MFRRKHYAARYTWRQLEAMPTIEQGQADDLKIHDREAGQKVWLSRMTREDGEHCDHHITVETLMGDGSWVETSSK